MRVLLAAQKPQRGREDGNPPVSYAGDTCSIQVCATKQTVVESNVDEFAHRRTFSTLGPMVKQDHAGFLPRALRVQVLLGLPIRTLGSLDGSDNGLLPR